MATAAAIADPSAIVFHDKIQKSGPVLALGDVAELRRLPVTMRARAASLALYTDGAVRPGLTLSHRMLASRTRALMPVLGPWLDQAYHGVLHINATVQRISASRGGLKAVVVGDAVTTHLRAGIYTIEREGRALQSAKSGERFFVRTTDGVVAAYCCDGAR